MQATILHRGDVMRSLRLLVSDADLPIKDDVITDRPISIAYQNGGCMESRLSGHLAQGKRVGREYELKISVPIVIT